MANKFTGITSAGVNVPVYDKEAHQALGNVYTKSEVDAELNTKQDNLSTEQLYNINNALMTSAIQFVSTSAEAKAGTAGVIYVVTGTGA